MKSNTKKRVYFWCKRVDDMLLNILLACIILFCGLFFIAMLATALFATLEGALDAWSKFYVTFERMFLR